MALKERYEIEEEGTTQVLGTHVLNTQVQAVHEEFIMQQINGAGCGNTCNVQVTDGNPLPPLLLDTSQYSYSSPSPRQQVVVPTGDIYTNKTFTADTGSLATSDINQCNDDDSDTHGHNKDISGSSMEPEVDMKIEVPDELTANGDSQNIYQHDYTGSIPVTQNIFIFGNSDQIPAPLGYPGSGLIEEEGEEKVINKSHSFVEHYETVCNESPAVMYLQPKDIFIPSPKDQRIGTCRQISTQRRISKRIQPSRSSKLTSESSLAKNLEIIEIQRIRPLVNDGVSVDYLNTGKIHFNMEPSFDDERKSPSRQPVETLAASGTIKDLDIASEVEKEICEVQVSLGRRRGRKKKDKVSGIANDIRQFRKESKDMGCKPEDMKKRKGCRERKKTRIYHTLAKSETPSNPAGYISDGGTKCETSRSSSGKKHGRKRKCRLETRNSSYQCKYCEVRFKTLGKLQFHTRVHDTKGRGFVCDKCGFRFFRRQHLVRHYHTHTNERPYCCSECGKSFKRSELLKRHSYVHSREKPFGCPMCPKTFVRHDRLIKHSLLHDE